MRVHQGALDFRKNLLLINSYELRRYVGNPVNLNLIIIFMNIKCSRLSVRSKSSVGSWVTGFMT